MKSRKKSNVFGPLTRGRTDGAEAFWEQPSRTSGVNPLVKSTKMEAAWEGHWVIHRYKRLCYMFEQFGWTCVKQGALGCLLESDSEWVGL